MMTGPVVTLRAMGTMMLAVLNMNMNIYHNPISCLVVSSKTWANSMSRFKGVSSYAQQSSSLSLQSLRMWNKGTFARTLYCSAMTWHEVTPASFRLWASETKCCNRCPPPATPYRDLCVVKEAIWGILSHHRLTPKSSCLCIIVYHLSWGSFGRCSRDPLQGGHVSMGKMPTAHLHLFLKGAMSAPIGRVTCSVWDKKSHPSDVNKKTPYHGRCRSLVCSCLLMGWRSRWCWQTRMRSQTLWCQWCRCRDSCRQGHPHRHLAPPSARPVPARTASTGCFLQKDWEWCPQSKASRCRQGPRPRKRAHARRNGPCCKFCHTESCKGAAFKELKLKPKSWQSPMWVQTR